ncbi:hypothetical protein M422DRAFT_275153 [Sphaerobolus stellatus SS14]|uniref:Uncharacterized protein n=1 Tax=Sphaerobolus stellatus (strain SS14) TaxID=990650 RepID=A0A0C9TQB3_SPHS4|nr:hypothetical protein M422DRAFT_275153 [Sphaerobolus stellatus SS14]
MDGLLCQLKPLLAALGSQSVAGVTHRKLFGQNSCESVRKKGDGSNRSLASWLGTLQTCLAALGSQSVAGVTHRKLLGQNYCESRRRRGGRTPQRRVRGKEYQPRCGAATPRDLFKRATQLRPIRPPPDASGFI